MRLAVGFAWSLAEVRMEQGLYTFKRRAFVRNASSASSSVSENAAREEEEDFEAILDEDDEALGLDKKRRKGGKGAKVLGVMNRKTREALKHTIEEEEEEGEDDDDEVQALEPVIDVYNDTESDETVFDAEVEMDEATQRRMRLLEEARQAREKLAEAEMADNEVSGGCAARDGEETQPIIVDDDACPKLRVAIVCAGDFDKKYFDILENEPFSKLISVFASDRGVDASTCSFEFDGQKIVPDQTPGSLGIMDRDMIEAIAPPRSEPKLEPSPPTDDERSHIRHIPPQPQLSKPEKRAKARDKVTLIVTRRGDKTLKVKIYAHDRFEKVITNYASLKKIDAARLRLEYEGRRLAHHESPADLNMPPTATVIASV